MSAPESPPAAADARLSIKAQLEAELARRPPDFNTVCRLGAAAGRMGMAEQAGVALNAVTRGLLAMIRAGNAENALDAELAIYSSFIRSVEIEEHYERTFSQWREPMAALGRASSVPLANTRNGRIGFVLHAGVVLGHTEVLFRLLETRDAGVDARIYVFGPCNPEFLARAKAVGVPVEVFADPPRWGGNVSGYFAKLQWVRAQMQRDAVNTAVWISVPATASLAMAMRLAPVQVFWALRYHPVHLPEIDGYITYGSWHEEEKTFHGQRWTVCPVPLALDPRVPPRAQSAELRARFPEKVLLGTLARMEKIDSRPFLASVVEIMRRNPQCGYVWTGHSRHPGIQELFESSGIADRCHFVGWVDTPLYASILDVFLETFPLGCGITGYQALAAGVPLVSYALANTVFGMQYWSELMSKAGSEENVTREMLDEYPVLCARNGAEYVELVTRLVGDAQFRDEWKAREARFFTEEIASIARYSRRFFGTIAAITEKASAP